MSQETYMYQKKPAHVKRDLLISSHHASLPLSYLKEAHRYQKRPINIKKDLLKLKKTCTCQKRPAELLPSGVSAPLIFERGLHTSKETNKYQKRPTKTKKDLYMSTETC